MLSLLTRFPGLQHRLVLSIGLATTVSFDEYRRLITLQICPPKISLDDRLLLLTCNIVILYYIIFPTILHKSIFLNIYIAFLVLGGIIYIYMLYEKKNSQIFIVLVVCVSFSYICNSLHSCAKKVEKLAKWQMLQMAKQPLLFTVPVQLCACGVQLF